MSVHAAPNVELNGDARTGHVAVSSPVKVLQVYVVMLVLIPPTHVIGPLGAIGTPATVVGVLALVLWSLAAVLPGDHLRRTVVPLRVVMGTLLASFFASYALLHLRYVPWDELLGSDRALLQVLSWTGVCLLAAEGLRDRREVVQVLRTLVVAVAVMAAVGFLQFRFGVDLASLADHLPGLRENTEHVTVQDREGFRRPAGTATHPIEFGAVLAVTLAFGLHLARFDRARPAWRRWLPMAVIALGVPVAVSRSAVLGTVVAVLVVFAGLEPRARPRFLGAAALFTVAVFVTTPGLLGAIRDLFLNMGSDTSITYRTDDYAVVAEYLREAPLLGRGPGTLLPSNHLFLDNQYLLSVIEVGIVGVVVVAGYLLSAAFFGRGARHRSSDPEVRDLGQAFAAASLAGAVTAFTFDAFSFLMFAGIVPLCLGLAGGLWAMQRSARTRLEVHVR